MKLDSRELGTVLAALRFWQSMTAIDSRFLAIATNGDQQNPLTDDEIDALCERLNS